MSTYSNPKSISLFFLVLAVLLTIGIIMIPNFYEKTLYSSARSMTLLAINNLDLWATTPGKLNSTTRNKFQFFNVSFTKDNYDISLSNESYLLEESKIFKSFEFDPKSDQVTFKADTSYNNTGTSNYSQVNQIDLGLMELLNTITNPPEYQKVTSALKIMLEKGLGSSEVFIKKLFTVYAFDYVMKNKDKVLATILQNFPKEKAEKLYSVNDDYRLGNIKGFYKWVLLIGDEELISNSNWLNKVYDLSYDEASQIVGNKSFLRSLYLFFNNKLSFNFKCNSKAVCGPEILYLQLNNSAVTQSFKIENIKALNEMIDPDLYPFDYTPEMNSFYKQFYAKTNQTEHYNINLSLGPSQMHQIFYNDTTLLTDPYNLIDLVYFNKTGDLYSSYLKFNLKSRDQMKFLSSYVINFLPSAFLYTKIDATTPELKTPFANGLATLIQLAIDYSNRKLSTKGNIMNVMISRVIERKFQIISDPGRCNRIFLSATGGDANRTNLICQNEKLNLISYESIKAWVLPYKCIYFQNCREEDKNYLKATANLTNEEFVQVYKNYNLGQYINDAVEIIVDHYNCNNCEEDTLAEMQWKNSGLTTNPPKVIYNLTATTLTEWDSVEFPHPLELKHYQIFTQADFSYVNECLYSLYNTMSNLTHPLNSFAFRSKITLEELTNKYTQNIPNATISEWKLSGQELKDLTTALLNMTKNIFFNAGLEASYEPEQILYGNLIANEKYLPLLSMGGYFDNFRPNLTMSTPIIPALSNNITMQTGYDKHNQIARTISSINNVNILNTNAKIFSPTKNSYVSKNVPLANLTLINETQFSDGFYYSTDDDMIYYMDEITSKILQFKYSSTRAYKNQDCKEYQMTDNLTITMYERELPLLRKYDKSSFTEAFIKFNKPLLISKPKALTSQFIGNFTRSNLSFFHEDKTFNYICVDSYTNLVVQSNISLVFSTYTNELNLIDSDIPYNQIIPLLYYQRSYHIDQDAYAVTFPGILNYSSTKLAILIVGLIVVLSLLGVSVCFCMRHRNYIKAHRSENLLNN